MLVLLALLSLQDPAHQRAESLLAAGRPVEAARLMETVVRRDPRSAAAQMLLGRAHFARPVVGRYPALRAFRAAARLAPDDPLPLYWQMLTGFHLGSDEGEGVAREAMIRIFALDPAYRDTWSRFLEVFGNADSWRRAAAAFSRHPHHPLALARRGHLALLLDDPERADSLLAAAQAAGDGAVETMLLRAEARFLAGDAAAGHAWIEWAVAHADEDTGEALWQRFWTIASPAEQEAYAQTLPARRPEFFTAFLERRDPNLVTPENERVVEHFARVQFARQHFRLLHPQSLYHRSARARGMAEVRSRALLRDLAVSAPTLFLGTPTARAAAATGLGVDARTLGARDTSETTLYYLAGLDARGLLWLRHGPPRQRLGGTLDALVPFVDGERVLDMESWVYDSPDGPVSVGFERRSGSVWRDLPAGDFLFTPASRRQQAWTRELLRTDRTAIPATLDAPAWTAFFIDPATASTAVYARTRAGNAVAVLWDLAGHARSRAHGTGVLRLLARPGLYELGLDVEAVDGLGRVRGAIAVPAFRGPSLALSSLVLGAADSVAGRDAALAAMPPDLTFPSGAPLAAYAEVYHLRPDSLERARYRVRYRFEPRRSLVARLFGGGAPVVLEFDREVPARLVTPEHLIITPERLPAGRYRVALTVTDLVADVKSETTAIEVEVR